MHNYRHLFPVSYTTTLSGAGANDRRVWEDFKIKDKYISLKRDQNPTFVIMRNISSNLKEDQSEILK